MKRSRRDFFLESSIYLSHLKAVRHIAPSCIYPGVPAVQAPVLSLHATRVVAPEANLIIHVIVDPRVCVLGYRHARPPALDPLVAPHPAAAERPSANLLEDDGGVVSRCAKRRRCENEIELGGLA